MDSEKLKEIMQKAEKGNWYEQKELGDCYAMGDGVEQDYKKAVEWYTKSAKNGNIVAQLKLYDMYHDGIGVEKDAEKAFEWLKIAAEQDEKDRKQFWEDYEAYGAFYVHDD